MGIGFNFKCKRLRLSWKWRARVDRLWRWVHASKWPFVLKSSLRAECKKRDNAADMARIDHAKEIAVLRDEMGPILDKLMRVRAGTVYHEYVVPNTPEMAWNVNTRYSSLKTRRVDASLKYRVCVDIADDMLRFVLQTGHQHDDYALREIARRVEHMVYRELKTINFKRYEEK